MIIRRANSNDPPGIAKVHVTSWQTTYPGIIPDNYLAGLSYKPKEHMWRNASTNANNPAFVNVAEDSNDKIVGFAAGGPERSGNSLYKGELYAIYLYAQHQHCGLGRRLIAAIAGQLLQNDIKSMLVWVLAKNRACGFYEALGGKRVAQQEIEFTDTTLNEFAYGWQDNHLLIPDTYQ